MAKPTDLPEWASSPQDANDIVVPSAGRKQTGWHRNAGVPEKPPYQFFNWFMNLVYQWINWFDSNINQGVKTTDSPSFANLAITGTFTFPFKNIKNIPYDITILTNESSIIGSNCSIIAGKTITINNGGSLTLLGDFFVNGHIVDEGEVVNE